MGPAWPTPPWRLFQDLCEDHGILPETAWSLAYDPQVAWDLLRDHGDTVTYPPEEEEAEEDERVERERPKKDMPRTETTCGVRPFCANCGAILRCMAACKDHVIAAAILGPVIRMHSGKHEDQGRKRKATGPPGGR